MKYGTYLSFEKKSDFLTAHRKLQEWSCEHETFSAFAVEETFSEDKSKKSHPVKRAGLIGAVLGIAGGFFMQWFANTVDMPLNIGGRPLNSWPAFVPVTWVLCVLCSGLSIFITLWVTLRLPRPYQSLFNAKHYRHEPGQFGILIPPLHPSAQPREDSSVLDLDSLPYSTCEEVPC